MTSWKKSASTSFRLSIIVACALTGAFRHVSSLGGSIIRTVFGLSLAKTNDKYIKMFEEAVDTVELIVHGVVLEYFPVLAGIPTWFPGTGYLKELEDARRLTATMRDVPFEDARSEVVCRFFTVNAALGNLVFCRTPA